jgi:outer membrane receptor protein involved in Fe transport
MAAVHPSSAYKGMDFMKLEFRQRLLATTLLVGASVVAGPAFAQDTNPNTNPPDTSAVPTVPETTAPVEGTTQPTTSATGETVKSSQDIIVTGSRIPQPNLESASPVTVVSSQEVKVSGTTRTEDLINSLPQSFAAQGSNISNGATGAATINLRGLGVERTLVLINGRRMQSGDPRQPVADINFIPTQLIKRVDVLTGGASSVYGADAVAGVVNFIMDTNFTGFRLDGQASVFNHHQHANQDITNANELRGFFPPNGWSTNGGAQDIAGVFGAAFDDGRGHVQAYATYRKQDPVLESTRDYAFCSLGSISAQYRQFYGPDYGNFYCGGSSTAAKGTFRQANPVTGSLFGPSRTFHVEGDEFVKGADVFNFAPYNYFQRPDERYTLGAFGDYEISPAAKPYLEAMFMNDRSEAQIAPSGSFNSVTVIACDNVLLSAQQRATLCDPFLRDADGDPETPPVLTDPTFVGPLNGQNGIVQTRTRIARRNVEGGGRVDDLEHTSWRLVAGMRGDVARGISYDAYYQYGTTHLDQTYFNDFSVTRLRRATDVIANPAVGGVAGVPVGAPVCRAAVTGIDPDCVPYNIFTEGGVDPAALTYLQTPGFQRGEVNETIAHADFTVTGDEYGWRLPWAENGIGINVGAEYRRETLKTTVDEEFRLGDLAGQGGPTPPVSGAFDVRELFGEVQIPIIEHSFIDLFNITAGYRYSNYHVGDNSFNTDAYKIATELAPIPDIRARASYNRAVRAPNIQELFFPSSLGLSGSVDPCAGAKGADGTVNGFTAAQCANSGVTAAQFGSVPKNPANQYNALFSGNIDLSPEKADTYTAGLVLQPRWVPGLAVTADYFDIKIDNLIATYPWNNVLLACVNGGGPLCDLIHRDSAGSLWLDPDGFVDLTTTNVGGERTKGVDLNATYSRRLGGLGTLNFSFVGTWLDELSFDTGVDPGVAGYNGKFDCAGLYGGTCGTPNPKWRHKLRVGLTMPSGIGVSVQWRHFSGVKADTLSADCDLNGDVAVNGSCAGRPGIDEIDGTDPGDARLSAREYFDLAFTARLAQRLNLRIGANNIFDRDAPVQGMGLGNGNTFPQVYDALGRYIFAGFTLDF